MAQVATPPAPPSPKPVPKEPVRVPPVIDAKNNCDLPEYPSSSIRNGEEGTVALNFLVDVNGKVIDSKIETSSGFSKLDRAARDALAHCRFKPGTVDGKPEQQWFIFSYKWTLSNR